MRDERKRIGNIKQDDSSFYDVRCAFRMQLAIPVQRPSSTPLTDICSATVGAIQIDWPAPSIPAGSLARLDGFGYIPPLGGTLSRGGSNRLDGGGFHTHSWDTIKSPRRNTRSRAWTINQGRAAAISVRSIIL